MNKILMMTILSFLGLSGNAMHDDIKDESCQQKEVLNSFSVENKEKLN